MHGDDGCEGTGANGPVERRVQGYAVPSGNRDLLLRAGGGGDCNFNQEKDQQTE